MELWTCVVVIKLHKINTVKSVIKYAIKNKLLPLISDSWRGFNVQPVRLLQQTVFHTVELQDTNERNLPYTECVIVNSGRIPVKEPFVVEVDGW